MTAASLNAFTRRLRKPIGHLAALLGCVLCMPVALADIEPFVVRDIRIEGLQRIEEGTVYNYLPVNPGDRVDQQRIEEALLAVYETGIFRDVELRRDGDVLIVAVLERPSIAEFTITGNEDIETEELTDSLKRVGLKRGGTFDRSVLEDVTGYLTDQYYSRGKYGVGIETEVEELDGNTVSIAIDIDEGQRARIRQINIVGNQSFSDEAILDDFELKTPNWLSFFRKDDRYARETLAGDREKLRQFYMDRGFADFEIASTQVAISPDKKDIYITVNVSEGERYTISDVKLAGDLIVPETELNSLVLVKPGQTFSLELLTQTTELMGFRLGEEGYAFAQIEPIPDIDRESKEVGVTFYIEPGNRVYVRRINFSGTVDTNDEVYRREMRQFEGAYLNNRAVERSEQRIRRLPFVEEVEVETTPVAGSPDLVDVDVNVTEGVDGQFGGGVGFSESQGIILNGNFVHANFLGSGERVQADINSGRFATLYSLSHTDPYRTPNEISRTVEFSYRDIAQFTSGASDFSTETLNARLQYGYPITEVQTLSFGLKWTEADLLTSNFSSFQSVQWVSSNGDSFAEALGPSLAVFGTSFSSYELLANWTYDSRNRVLFADRGSRHQITVSTTGPGSEVEYYAVGYDLRKYWPIVGDWTLALNAELAFADDFNDTTDIPPFQNFFAGGPDTVRGFRENHLGPVDSLGNPYGGNLKVASQLELLIPTPEKLGNSTRFSLFYDIGNVFSTGDTTFFDRRGDPIDYEFDYDELKHSAGIAAEWVAPIGLFKFSFAIPLNDYEGDSRTFPDEVERFQFSVGGAF
ncbi:MAG: outer membrane protein assembly factor BamA [Gammaproteobacteria bacterium]|nr:outer membrane protein assembly factor BamA [Gammaproteobacteria bacterium]